MKYKHWTAFTVSILLISCSAEDDDLIEHDEVIEPDEAIEPGEDIEHDPGEVGFRAYCFADCLDGSGVGGLCSGTCAAFDQVCNGSSASEGYWTCNGALGGSCPVDDEDCGSPPAPCFYNNISYQDGQGSTLGAICSAKRRGYCIGGVRAGESCVGSGECYAVCEDGVWVPTF